MRKDYYGAWCRKTSSDPRNWTEDNPSWGQCAVTALVIQDFFGGELLRATVDGFSHYWNRLPDGSEKDLTRQQFGPNAKVDGDPEVRDRGYVLSYPDTERRYHLLRDRMGLA